MIVELLMYFKILVAEHLLFGNFYNIKFKVGGLVAIIAGIGKQSITGNEMRNIFLRDGIVHTVYCRFYHANKFGFFSFFLELLNIFYCFHNFMYFKICQLPVIVLPGKPQFGMMALYTAHEFAKAGFISCSQLLFHTINMCLQFPRLQGGLVATE